MVERESRRRVAWDGDDRVCVCASVPDSSLTGLSSCKAVVVCHCACGVAYEPLPLSRYFALWRSSRAEL